MQAALIAYSENLVVVETDAGCGYVSLVGLDPAGPAKSVPTMRDFFRNESLLGGHRGHLKVVLVEDDASQFTAARANAALGGPFRFRACAVGSDFLSASGGGAVSQFPYSQCGLSQLLAQRASSAGGAHAERARRRSLLHESSMDDSSGAHKAKPAALLVLNEPSPSALNTLRALLRDGTAAGVAADLGPQAADGGERNAWEPFVAALSAAGFTTHGLVRPIAERLRDPEPREGSMLHVPANGTTLAVAWANATAFVSARKPLLHLDSECQGKVRRAVCLVAIVRMNTHFCRRASGATLCRHWHGLQAGVCVWCYGLCGLLARDARMGIHRVHSARPSRSV